MKPYVSKASTRKCCHVQEHTGITNSIRSRVISCPALNSYGALFVALGMLTFVIVALIVQPTAHASNPTAGTLNTTSTQVTWRGTATGGAAVGDPVLGFVTSEDLCIEGTNCDSFTLTIGGTPIDWANAQKLVHVHLGWTIPTQDFDLYIHRGDLNGPVVANSGNGATNGILTSEDAELDPSSPSIGTGMFTVHVVYYAATSADQYTGTASVANVPPPPTPGPTPTPTNEPPGTPRFYSYFAPPGVADAAGEPSIGVNWRTERTFGGIPNGGTVNFFGGFLPYMLRVTFDDALTPAKAIWEKAGLTIANAPRLFGDPILFTDHQTGRTFVSQEMGLTPLGSTMEWTDNDGNTFLPSEGSGAPSGIDHETVGGGPYAQPLPTGINPVYPNGVWYCSQSIADAVCSLSLDGGMTFGPAVPMYSLLDCGGIHGHIKIGPDGTAYVPNVQCGSNQAVIVSENNGISWSIRKLPQSSAADRDPSVAVGSDSTLYFAYQNADGHSHVATSHDKGVTWVDDTDIGAQLGIKNGVFHAAVAGDGDRAAVAFFGTTTGGTDYNTPGFTGIWYLYIATTYDRGKTWWTQNATPGDPIQRGGICTTGACRNLLDFFGAEIDKEGRVLVGYEDGCVTRACITGQRSYGIPADNDFTAKAVIARQTGGKRMFATYDPPPGPVAEPPARPLPPAPGISCDGNVASDPVGDASHPLLGSNGGSTDQVDITGLNFSLSADGHSLVSTITLANFSTTPITGTLGTLYNTVWTAASRNADGSITSKTYATQANVSLIGTTYTFGQYDPGGDSFLSGTTTTVTGSTTAGPGGTVKVNVPLALLGNPTIPVTDLDALPAVIEPYAAIFAHEEAVRFTAKVDRAPDAGSFGANWAVCNVAPTVSIVSPANGATFTAPATITITANAADSDGTVSKVEFFQGSTKLGEDTSTPFSFTWSGVAPGNYSLTAKATDNSHATATSNAVNISVNELVCLDDDDARISYSSGWHSVGATNASGGHFRFHSGNNPGHSASVTFTVGAGKTGKLTYYYATSTRGGSADVLLDGLSQGAINYHGNIGSTKAPLFGPKIELANLAPGQHTLVIKNMRDDVYVDGFCLENSSSNSQPTQGPGETSSSDRAVQGGQESSSDLPISSGATAISVVAESSNDLPIKLLLISPSGSVLQTADSSNGVAVIDSPVSQAGTYIFKVVNLNLGPVEVWTVATPTIRR